MQSKSTIFLILIRGFFQNWRYLLSLIIQNDGDRFQPCIKRFRKNNNATYQSHKQPGDFLNKPRLEVKRKEIKEGERFFFVSVIF